MPGRSTPPSPTDPRNYTRAWAPLDELLREAEAGRGAVAIVNGPVAAGKTTLLHAFAEHASESGAQVLRAACSRREQKLAFGVARQLFGRAGQAPPASALRTVVLTVDDVQYADRASLECLLFLARRVGSLPVVVVMSERTGAPDALVPFRTEVERQPHHRRIYLNRLSVDQVEQVLAQSLRRPVNRVLVSGCYAATGGNLLLLDGLLEDLRSADSGHELTCGRAFRQAVLGCLHRCDESAVAAARALAVLGRTPSDALLLKAPSVTPFALDALQDSGLVAGRRFRHPAVREAILEEYALDERVSAHLATARLLADAAASPGEVAEQLLAAHVADEPWMRANLREAAAEALVKDNTDLAVRCLRLVLFDDSHGGDAGSEDRTDDLVALAFAEARSDPETSVRHFLCAVRSAPDAANCVPVLTSHLVRRGQGREALRLLAATALSPAEHRSAQLLVATEETSLMPEVVAKVGDVTADLDEFGDTVSARAQAATALAALLLHGPDSQVVSLAEQAMQGTALAEEPLPGVLTALTVLIYADESARALPWCDRLVREATRRHAPAWRAYLSGVRADIAVRQGAYDSAIGHARTALDLLTPDQWGVRIGRPLSALILALTLTGDTTRASAELATPVPERLFHTRHGLHFLHARGRLLLSTGQPEAALADFLACGRRMQDWGVDQPAVVPWRGAAAEACRMLGEPERAETLAQEEDALVAPDRAGYAALTDAERRVTLLASRGKMNREIAEHLFVTVSTVEQHLTRIYRKLGVTRRSELIATLARLERDDTAPAADWLRGA